jgi:hypothetical protein
MSEGDLYYVSYLEAKALFGLKIFFLNINYHWFCAQKWKTLYILQSIEIRNFSQY